jgi:hypothetical protein
MRDLTKRGIVAAPIGAPKGLALPVHYVAQRKVGVCPAWPQVAVRFGRCGA